jgi:hypothetical protein
VVALGSKHMRSLMLAAAAALALASVASAAGKHTDSSSPPLFTMDAKGKCHDAHGKFVAGSMCHAGRAPKHCVKGKACGSTCIKATDVCHKPS